MLKILSFFYKNYNYGGMLQAFALWRFFVINGYACEQIAFVKKGATCRPLLNRITALNARKVLRKCISMIITVATKIIANNLEKRRCKFCDFMNIVSYRTTYNAKTISGTVERGDIFIAGSDQIWNPDWTEDAYFLDFVPDENGKIAYAASIGKNKVGNDFLTKAVRYINRFDFISVREESAKKILQPWIEKPLKVVLDPTLLLTRSEWDKITVSPKIAEPYIFVYLLGESTVHRKIIKKMARLLGLKTVFLPHIHFRFNFVDCGFGDYHLYEIGPAEFVGLVKNAEMMITDSFHGCVFSIIYEKKFWVLKRHKDSDQQNMNSRLYTLFDSLGLGERLVDDEQTEYDVAYLDSPIDYSEVAVKLEALRKDSSDFLLNAIESVRQRMIDDKHISE